MDLKPPIFLIGLKAYIWGEKALRLARVVEEISEKTSVTFCLIPQLVDLYRLASEVEVPILAPTMDPIRPGRGVGRNLPEAIKEAGAVGVMLNHSENRMTLNEINESIRRAHEVGLLTLVCCESPEEAAAITLLGADLVLAEPPALIGSLRSVGRLMKDFVKDSIKAVKELSSKTLILAGGGVASPEDAAEIIRLGADGTGASRAVHESRNPKTFLEEVARSIEKEWKTRLRG